MESMGKKKPRPRFRRSAPLSGGQPKQSADRAGSAGYRLRSQSSATPCTAGRVGLDGMVVDGSQLTPGRPGDVAATLERLREEHPALALSHVVHAQCGVLSQLVGASWYTLLTGRSMEPVGSA